MSHFITLLVIVLVSLLIAAMLHRGLADARVEVIDAHGRQQFWVSIILINATSVLDILTLILVASSMQ